MKLLSNHYVTIIQDICYSKTMTYFQSDLVLPELAFSRQKYILNIQNCLTSTVAWVVALSEWKQTNSLFGKRHWLYYIASKYSKLFLLWHSKTFVDFGNKCCLWLASFPRQSFIDDSAGWFRWIWSKYPDSWLLDLFWRIGSPTTQTFEGKGSSVASSLDDFLTD